MSFHGYLSRIVERHRADRSAAPAAGKVAEERRSQLDDVAAAAAEEGSYLGAAETHSTAAVVDLRIAVAAVRHTESPGCRATEQEEDAVPIEQHRQASSLTNCPRPFATQWKQGATHTYLLIALVWRRLAVVLLLLPIILLTVAATTALLLVVIIVRRHIA